MLWAHFDTDFGQRKRGALRSFGGIKMSSRQKLGQGRMARAWPGCSWGRDVVAQSGRQAGAVMCSTLSFLAGLPCSLAAGAQCHMRSGSSTDGLSFAPPPPPGPENLRCNCPCVGPNEGLLDLKMAVFLHLLIRGHILTTSSNPETSQRALQRHLE